MRGLKIYLKKENTTGQEKMDEAMRMLYEKSVPEPVREYLDIISAPAARPKRPPRPSQPKAAVPSPTTDPVKSEKEGTV